MAQVVVAVALGDLVGPLFELRRVDLDGGPAVAAGQVVVMRVDDASTKEALTAVSHDDVHLTVGDQFLQLRVDRRQGGATPVAHYEGVEFLGADEALNPREDGDDLAALGGVASCHGSRVPVEWLLSRIILDRLTGMVLKKVLTVSWVTAVALAVAVSPTAAAPKPLVVAGVSEWAALARVVAGNDAVVVSLLSDPNADPHDHEATISDAEHVAQASVVIENGAGYDTWLAKLVQARARPPVVVDAARLASVSSGANPHLFFSVPVAERVVRALTGDLVARVVSRGVVSRSAALLTQLRRLDRSIRAIGAACRGVKVAATEDVAGYLLSEAGLHVVTPERLRLAVGNGVDPSVHDLALALTQLEAHPAFLLDNLQTATPLTNELVAQARTYHVPVIDVTETMTGSNYVTWIGHVVSEVSSALHRQGCLA